MPFELDAANDALAERQLLSRYVSPGRRKDALHAGARIGRAADDLHRRAGARIHAADPQPVGIRMRLRLDDRSDDETLQLFARIIDMLDLEADRASGFRRCRRATPRFRDDL